MPYDAEFPDGDLVALVQKLNAEYEQKIQADLRKRGLLYSYPVTCPDCGATLSIDSPVPLPDNFEIRHIEHRS